MSVTLDRFLRVMSLGMVVSDELVTARYDKTRGALRDASEQVARLAQAGLAANPGYVAQLRTLADGMAAAMEQPDNQAKCEALEPIKLALLTIAEDAHARADRWLAEAAAMRQKSTEAETAISQADLAIKQIADPVFRAPLETRLAGVENRRKGVEASLRPDELRRAEPLLSACITDANAIAAEAAQAAQLFAKRAGELAQVDTALSGLLAANANIVEVPQKSAADTMLAALTPRRDALANATADQIAQEMSRAGALLADIATATAISNLRVAWINTKARRDVIRKDADEYAAAGKRDGNPTLDGDATRLKEDLTNLETRSLTGPKAAIDELPTLQSAHDKLKADFKDKVADSNQLQRAKDLITANPDGPEAKMKAALGLDKLGKDVFERRLLKVYDTARKQGTPEINLLSPGEAVAIHSYTCGDYAQMNGHLLGINPLPDYPSNEVETHVLVQPTVDQVEIKNDQACAALKKLPNWPGGSTSRGVRSRYPDDDKDFAQSTYTLKAFWSTATTALRDFEGPWRFEITGNSGKNVKSLSRYPTEDEVLYLPGTTFQVISRSGVHAGKDDTRCITVILKEV